MVSSKKGIMEIFLILVSLTGAVLIFVPMLQAPEFNFIGASQLLGVFLFFIGMAVFFAAKAFNKCKKLQACVLLFTGLLATVFLLIGLSGFSKNMEDAQGAMGNSYASFSSEVENIALGRLAVASEGRLVFANVDDAKATLADAQGALALINGITAFLNAGIPPETTIETLVSVVSAVAPAQANDAENLAAGIMAMAIPGAANLSTALEIVNAAAGDRTTLEAAVGGIETVLSSIEENQKSADVGATALLFTYITMIIVLGLFPLIFALNKFAHIKQ